jgi:hypothetical protein
VGWLGGFKGPAVEPDCWAAGDEIPATTEPEGFASVDPSSDLVAEFPTLPGGGDALLEEDPAGMGEPEDVTDLEADGPFGVVEAPEPPECASDEFALVPGSAIEVSGIVADDVAWGLGVGPRADALIVTATVEGISPQILVTV